MNQLYAIHQTYAAELTFAALTLTIVLLIWNTVLTVRLRRLHGRYQAALGSSEGLDIEAMLGDVHSQTRRHDRRLDDVENVLDELRRTVRERAGRVGVVRYNPFAETGGNQSFALAIVDDAGSGVVVSSLHNRDATRVYAKPLDNGNSSHQLTDEEREAIHLALHN